jgi:YggT family protein
MSILINAVIVLFRILDWLIIGRIILSWIKPNPQDQRLRKAIRFIYQVTEPILAPIRRLLPTGKIGIDFSPFIAVLALGIIRNFLIQILSGLIY